MFVYAYSQIICLKPSHTSAYRTTVEIAQHSVLLSSNIRLKLHLLLMTWSSKLQFDIASGKASSFWSTIVCPQGWWASKHLSFCLKDQSRDQLGIASVNLKAVHQE